MKGTDIETNKIPIQTSLFAPTSCVFTGHRVLEEDFSKKQFKKLLEQLIKDGIKTFYNGLARGFDLTACETVLALKKKYKDIRLIGCIPCFNQDSTFPDSDKKRYQAVLKKLDETVLVSEKMYFNGCMHKRNRYMCDKADVMVAYCKKATGGTAYTVQYFQKTYPQKKVLFL